MSMANESYGDHERRELLPFLPPGTRTALDIGCHRGGFARALKSAGVAHVVGIEPNAQAAAAAREWCDEVVVGTFPEAPLSGTYDLIVLNDVLEHMFDPWGALRDATKLLAWDGHILASIPNLRFWYVLGRLLMGDFRYQDAGVLDRTHIRWFTKRTMRELFESAQLEVMTVAPINENRYWKGRLMALLLGKDVLAEQFVVVARTPSRHLEGG